jgi:hypothetical protein
MENREKWADNTQQGNLRLDVAARTRSQTGAVRQPQMPQPPLGYRYASR